MADGLYLGGVLNGTPTQFVRFSTTGIEISSPTQVKMVAPDVLISATTVEINASTSATITSPTINLTGAVVASSTITASGTITAPTVVGTTNVTFGGKSGIAHQHSGVSTGLGNSGPPI
jgi:phage baseplate assembly protein gpV